MEGFRQATRNPKPKALEGFVLQSSEVRQRAKTCEVGYTCLVLRTGGRESYQGETA